MASDSTKDWQSIVVVGASLAGVNAVEALRDRGFEGRIVLVSGEDQMPYDRPPLSKAMLAGKLAPAELLLRPGSRFDELEVDMRLGIRATRLNLDDRTVALSDATREPFDGLVIATGATPRHLAANGRLEGVFVLRTLEDCVALRTELATSPDVVVVGGGFVGAEVAATSRGLGLHVTVVEALPSPMSQALGTTIGDVFRAHHADNGVVMRCGVGVARLHGATRVSAVELTDGSIIPASVVVIGIGVVPESSWLEDSGLDLRNGVLCDSRCRSSAPGIVAAGDVANWHNTLFDEQMRVEHWENAVEQAEAAADALLRGNAAAPYAPVPYVWSDQYDLRVQVVGRPRASDEVRIADGTLDSRKFVALYLRDNVLVGAAAFYRRRLVHEYRKLIADRTPVDELSTDLAHS